MYIDISRIDLMDVQKAEYLTKGSGDERMPITNSDFVIKPDASIILQQQLYL